MSVATEIERRGAGEPDFDPFVLEILKSAFDTIADDMALILLRTSYSSIVRESMDFSTAICDVHGQTLAQGVTTPMHLGSFYDAMRALINECEGRIDPGDIFIFNDPYVAAGQHLPDIYIVKPVFEGTTLAGWATTVAHHSDVGGIVAGSNALGAPEIFAEGLRLPVIKFMERGQPVKVVWDIIALNVRTPDKVLGDLQAQVAACTTGERELKELFARYGFEMVSGYARHLHDYAERLARAEFRDIPDGTYRFTDHIDGLGPDPQELVLETAVTFEGDSASVDWTGSSDQVEGGINSPLPFTKACGYAALRAIMPADVPNCFGYTRAIDTVAPQGSLVNPVLPGPCGARGITGYRMIDCLFGALAQAVPDRVRADNSGGSTLPTISGWREGTPFVFCETFMGNSGGASTLDGEDGAPHIGANQCNVPVEMIEASYPLRIDSYGLVPDTGGPGKHRGGLALMREYRILAESAELNVRSDKRRRPPHGLYGGKDGTPSWNIINPGSEDRVLPVLLMAPERLKRGDVFRHIMSGAGGYGDPLERDPARVLDDVIAEKVSIERAAPDYGVVIEAGEPPTLDAAATTELRRKMQADGGGAKRALRSKR